MADFYDTGFNLKKCLIYPSSGSKTAVDVTFQLIELNLYEDIYSPYLTGNLIIQDALDLVTNLPIVGFEFLVLKFGKPQDPDGIEDITKTFRIYKPEIPNFDFATQANQVYVLRFCSEEALLSASRFVSKSYKGQTATQVVKDVLRNQLKVSPQKYNSKNIEDSKVKQDFISYWRPFELISWITNRTFPPFMFYENADGYNFKKIDTLMGQAPKHNYYYSTQNIPPDNTTALSRVTKFEFMKNYDVLRAIKGGMFASSLTTIDPIRRRVENHNFSYKDYFNKTVSVGDGSFQNEYKDRFGKAPYENNQSLRRVMITTNDHNIDPNIISAEPNINPNFIEQWMLQRISHLEQLDYFKLKLVIPGDLKITVGDIISFGLPTATIKDPHQSNLNPFHSGNYLLTAIRHKINLKAYEMILEGTMDSVTNSFPVADNSDTGLDGLRKA